MEAIARVVRVYGSTSQYRAGDQRLEPLEAADYPDEGDTLRVWFGAIPDEIASQLQVLVAKANTRLNVMLRGQSGGDEAIAEALKKVVEEDQVGLDELWYVTVAVDRPVTLPDAETTGNRFEWINPEAVEAPEDAFRPIAAQAIDMAIVAMTPLVPNRLVSERALARSYVFADDREATAAYRPRFTVKGVGIHSLADLPLDRLRVRIEALPGRREDWEPLELAVHWYEAMLQESEDDLKRFLWGFIALETLTNSLYSRLYDVVVAALHLDVADSPRAPHENVLALIRRKGQPRLAERFQIVSGYLSPATAADDSTRFRRLKKARDEIGHGLSRREALQFPTDLLSELLPRYFELALDLQA